MLKPLLISLLRILKYLFTAIDLQLLKNTVITNFLTCLTFRLNTKTIFFVCLTINQRPVFFKREIGNVFQDVCFQIFNCLKKIIVDFLNEEITQFLQILRGLD